MVYTIWYIPIAAWYVSFKSGIYHEATCQMVGPAPGRGDDSDGWGMSRESRYKDLELESESTSRHVSRCWFCQCGIPNSESFT